MAVDGADVVGEVDVDSGRDHGDEGEEDGVYEKERGLISLVCPCEI